MEVDKVRCGRGVWLLMKQDQGEAAWIYRKVLRHPLLPAFLRQQNLDREPVRVGWGYRASGRAACRAAERRGDRLLLIEDAFVRSVRPGQGRAVYGLLADSCGMHYDAGGCSDLLKALDSGTPTGWMRAEPMESGIAAMLMDRFRETGVSKYNWFPDEFRDAPPPETPGILVVDQTRGDMSIRHGGMVEADFGRMLRAALDMGEGSPVYLRAHPDHLFRSKRTCFPRELLADKRIRFLSPDLPPARCFSFCHTVVVGSSLMGMEALIHGKKVITYGAPFFAGRGLTEDFSPVIAAAGRRRATLLELFEAAYLRYCHYFDPDTGESCGLGEILDHLALQKEMFRRNRGHSVTVGFSPWKRKIVPDYLRSPAGKLSQVDEMSEAPADARLLVWGRKTEIPADLRSRAVRMEDGFIRSKGLGAAFNFPYSWVLDETGIYFDPATPSDLENLYHKGFDEDGLADARELIRILREKRLTKYNLSESPIQLDPQLIGGRKVILVPGQVEADASILYGSPELKTNLALLLAVRKAEPEAFLIFKAHPDLVAGTRQGRILPDGLEAAADLVVTEGNVLDWLDVCSEVHTMTSTAGFEALIREVPVVTYGLPFYAGWGLTTDRLECPRRKRKLTLEELVCGALVKYPRYLNPATGEFTTAVKVTRLLTSGGMVGNRRAWHLTALLRLKKIWVRTPRGGARS
jgi:capsular polysaccharide export protein